MKATLNTAHYPHYKFLEELRQSGATNMWGASPYLAKAFMISMNEANQILTEWISNYGTLVEMGVIERKEN